MVTHAFPTLEFRSLPLADGSAEAGCRGSRNERFRVGAADPAATACSRTAARGRRGPAMTTRPLFPQQTDRRRFFARVLPDGTLQAGRAERSAPAPNRIKNPVTAPG